MITVGSHSCSAANVTVIGRHVYGNRTAFGRRIYAIGGNLEAARLPGLTLNAPNLPCSLLTD